MDSQSAHDGSTAPNDPLAQASPASLRALETLESFLTQDSSWHVQRIENQPIFRASFSGHSANYTCYARIMPQLDQFLFYALVPVTVPEELRLATAEFITRANYGMRIGNFELDFSDGEVRYKSSLDFEGHDLTPDLIRNTIYPAVLTLDHYLPGLLSVIYGGRTPFEAIEDIEKQAAARASQDNA